MKAVRKVRARSGNCLGSVPQTWLGYAGESCSEAPGGVGGSGVRATIIASARVAACGRGSDSATSDHARAVVGSAREHDAHAE